VAHGSSLGLLVELLSHGYWEDQSKIERLALARPWRITISLDGIGEVHSMIRGRPDFFERTSRTLETLNRVRKERGVTYRILLKTVIMAHNLDDVCGVARYAREREMEVFYQPIEQNYNTPEDLRWFETSENWPKNAGKAVAAVERLIQLKRQGFPISNSLTQLEVMIPYFRDPERWQVSTQAHTAHERRFACAALGLLQVQANGDVRTCARKAPLGNFKLTPIRAIWENRPQWWRGGCCFDERCSETEKDRLGLASIQEPIRETT
jgi:MoaA/NifB/PqqE/SkfB family radical SAM enzyme